MLEDLKRVLSLEKELDLILIFAKCDLCFCGKSYCHAALQNFATISKRLSDIKLTAKNRLAVAGAPLGDAVKRDHLST